MALPLGQSEAGSSLGWHFVTTSLGQHSATGARQWTPEHWQKSKFPKPEICLPLGQRKMGPICSEYCQNKISLKHAKREALQVLIVNRSLWLGGRWLLNEKRKIHLQCGVYTQESGVPNFLIMAYMLKRSWCIQKCWQPSEIQAIFLEQLIIVK